MYVDAGTCMLMQVHVCGRTRERWSLSHVRHRGSDLELCCQEEEYLHVGDRPTLVSWQACYMGGLTREVPVHIRICIMKMSTAQVTHSSLDPDVGNPEIAAPALVPTRHTRRLGEGERGAPHTALHLFNAGV